MHVQNFPLRPILNADRGSSAGCATCTGSIETRLSDNGRNIKRW